MDTQNLGRLLLVEDETDVLDINAKHLKSLGYEVFTATTIEQARRIIWEFPPDLLLLDIMLPDGSGLDFCTEFRKTNTAPIIFLTCLDDKESTLQGLLNGAEDYVIKPYNIDILSARIAAQLRRTRQSNGQFFLPPLILNKDTGQVTLCEKDIPLTPKEFQTLCFLAERNGQEFSQSAIFKAVWQENPETMGSTVRVTVSRIRSKMRFQDDGYFEIMTTGSGGYAFLRLQSAI